MDEFNLLSVNKFLSLSQAFHATLFFFSWRENPKFRQLKKVNAPAKDFPSGHVRVDLSSAS